MMRTLAGLLAMGVWVWGCKYHVCVCGGGCRHGHDQTGSGVAGGMRRASLHNTCNPLRTVWKGTALDKQDIASIAISNVCTQTRALDWASALTSVW